MRFHGSKALILFTRRIMPAELRLQSDRETQKSEIYFTDRTLSRNQSPWLLTPSPANRCRWSLAAPSPNFFSPIALCLGTRALGF